MVVADDNGKPQDLIWVNLEVSCFCSVRCRRETGEDPDVGLALHNVIYHLKRRLFTEMDLDQGLSAHEGMQRLGQFPYLTRRTE